MAYSATVVRYGPYIADGRRYWQVECSETDAGASDEWSFSAGPGPASIVTIVHFVSTHDSGSGSTVQPKLGTKTGLGAIDTRLQFDAAAAEVSDASHVTFALDDSDGKIYVRTTADSGADNVQSSRITYCEGAP